MDAERYIVRTVHVCYEQPREKDTETSRQAAAKQNDASVGAATRQRGNQHQRALLSPEGIRLLKGPTQ